MTAKVIDGKATVRNEGAMGEPCPNPYPVSYRSIVPLKDECSNLLVPVCLSSTHIAYGSIRMEPVFMILGQSAGTAAVMALESKIPVQDVPYDKLRARLLADARRFLGADELHEPPVLDRVALEDRLPRLASLERCCGNGVGRNQVLAGYIAPRRILVECAVYGFLNNLAG